MTDVAGDFSVFVKMDGLHVLGSPASLNVVKQGAPSPTPTVNEIAGPPGAARTSLKAQRRQSTFQFERSDTLQLSTGGLEATSLATIPEGRTS